jgi:sn-glycerol 3-phosphate transport system permease protein
MTRRPVSRAVGFWTERRTETITFLVLVAPNLILLAMWTYWPFLQSLYLSLTNWNPLNPNIRFVGIDNYVRLLSTPLFWQITRNSLIFAMGTVSVGLSIALGLALLLNQQLVGRPLWRFVYFSPHVTTSAAIALVWSAIYDPQYGVLSSIGALFGLRLPSLLGSTIWVLPALMLVAIWKGLGFSTVIFLAALQGVDKTLKEAAAIDGAGSWQQFRHVTFPAISPITNFLIIVGILNAVKTFDLIAVMTGGGPANASNMYVYQIYQEAFVFLRMGMASALAVVMLVLITALTLLQNWFKERWVNY